MKWIKRILICFIPILAILICILSIITLHNSAQDKENKKGTYTEEKNSQNTTESLSEYTTSTTTAENVYVGATGSISEVELEDENQTTQNMGVDVQYPDSGIIICIDPGHYKGRNVITAENSYNYDEGVFNLKLALALSEELEHYGIHSVLTRDTDSITLEGLTDGNLDGSRLSLRGEYAEGTDLFISIHTNANLENANGYPTCQQPVEINKTIILLSELACGSDTAINVANCIGEAVTKASYDNGLSWTDTFKMVDSSSVSVWSDSLNDALNSYGTVCYREGDDGDFYGVLRGATSVGVPGMIIEHGFHTVAEMRYQAMEGNLAAEWARAEAYGIAKGYGIVE